MSIELFIDMTMIDSMGNSSHAINLDIFTHVSSSTLTGSMDGHVCQLAHFGPDWKISTKFGVNGMKFCTVINGPQ